MVKLQFSISTNISFVDVFTIETDKWDVNFFKSQSLVTTWQKQNFATCNCMSDASGIIRTIFLDKNVYAPGNKMHSYVLL